MIFLDIPARNDAPWYSFTITLSEIVFTLTFRYNVRMDRWILDVGDASGNDLLVGIPILIDRDLIGRFAIEGLPEGTLFAIDNTNKNNQPTRYSFGLTSALIYADPAA